MRPTPADLQKKAEAVLEELAGETGQKQASEEAQVEVLMATAQIAKRAGYSLRRTTELLFTIRQPLLLVVPALASPQGFDAPLKEVAEVLVQHFGVDAEGAPLQIVLQQVQRDPSLELQRLQKTVRERSHRVQLLGLRIKHHL